MTQQTSRPEPILVLVSDLLFGSRITSTAANLGRPVQILRNPLQLEKQGGTKLIVDLNQPGALPAAAQWLGGAKGREVIGFVAHVDAATISAAKEAGITQVLPRSRFVDLLSDLLKK
jgi:hypothetical protein